MEAKYKTKFLLPAVLRDGVVRVAAALVVLLSQLFQPTPCFSAHLGLNAIPAGLPDPFSFQEFVGATNLDSDVRTLFVLKDGRFYAPHKESVARFHPDGSVDPTFHFPKSLMFVTDIRGDDDGNVYVSGFNVFPDTTEVWFHRHLGDGRVDPEFDPGANTGVGVIRFDAANRVIVAGTFPMSSEQTGAGIRRLLLDGQMDPSFEHFAVFEMENLNGGGFREILSLPDGGMMVSGSFISVDGVKALGLAKLDARGNVVATFSPQGWRRASELSHVTELLPRLDGTIWVACDLLNDQGLRVNLLAIREDCSLAPNFIPIRINPYVSTNALEYVAIRGLVSDKQGRLIIAGYHRMAWRGFVRRFLPDMTEDRTFLADPSVTFDSIIEGMSMMPDERLLLGGRFSSSLGVKGPGLMFLNTSDARTFAPILQTDFIQRTNKIQSDLVLQVRAWGNPNPQFRWFRDDQFLPNGGSELLTLTNVDWSTAGQYSVEASNVYGSTRIQVANVVVPPAPFQAGDVDSAWSPPSKTIGSVLILTPMGNQGYCALVTMLDGGIERSKALVMLDKNLTQARVAVPDIPLETDIRTMIATRDEGIVMGGRFRNVAGGLNTNLVRFNPDMTLDALRSARWVPNGAVNALALDSLGRLVLGGDFSEIAQVKRTRLARFTTQFQTDPAFDLTVGPNLTVRMLAPISTGIFVAGDFLQWGTNSQRHIARVDNDGRLDLSFDAGEGFDRAPNSLLASDGESVFVGGAFTKYQGQGVQSLVHLGPDGAPSRFIQLPLPGFPRVNHLSYAPNGSLIIAAITDFVGARPVSSILLNLDRQSGLVQAVSAKLGGGVTAVLESDNHSVYVMGTLAHPAVQPTGLFKLRNQSVPESRPNISDHYRYWTLSSNGLMHVSLPPGHYSYQWLNQGKAITNATNSLYVAHFAAGQFTTNLSLRISNSIGDQVMGSFTLTRTNQGRPLLFPSRGAWITAHGHSIQFPISNTMDAIDSVQWFHDFNPVHSGHSPPFQFPFGPAFPSDSGTYLAVVLGPFGVSFAGPYTHEVQRIESTLGAQLGFSQGTWFTSTADWVAKSWLGESPGKGVQWSGDGSFITLNVNGPGVLAWSWRTENEENAANVSLWYDGRSTLSKTSNSIWSNASIPVSSGSHRIDWFLAQSDSSTPIYASLANVSWTPSTSSAPVIQRDLEWAYDEGSQTTGLYVGVGAADPFVFTWMNRGLPVHTNHQPYLLLHGAAPTPEDRYEVLISNPFGNIISRSISPGLDLIKDSQLSISSFDQSGLDLVGVGPRGALWTVQFSSNLRDWIPAGRVSTPFRWRMDSLHPGPANTQTYFRMIPLFPE